MEMKRQLIKKKNFFFKRKVLHTNKQLHTLALVFGLSSKANEKKIRNPNFSVTKRVKSEYQSKLIDYSKRM